MFELAYVYELPISTFRLCIYIFELAYMFERHLHLFECLRMPTCLFEPKSLY